MMSSAVTRLNITFMNLQNSWMENMRMLGSWSRDTGLVSDEITKIKKGSSISEDG